jgi:hypothetical protein
MPRSLVVPLPVFATLLSGCATPPRRPQADAAGEGRLDFASAPPAPEGRSVWQWLNEHPPVKYGGIALVVLLCAGAVLFAAAASVGPGLGRG